MRNDLNDTPFEGVSRSFTILTGTGGGLDCQRSRSSLFGRREKVRRQTTAGIRYVTETFRCRCGRGRHIKWEVAAG